MSDVVGDDAKMQSPNSDDESRKTTDDMAENYWSHLVEIIYSSQDFSTSADTLKCIIKAVLERFAK